MEPVPKEIEARALWFAAPRTAELRPEIAPPPGPGDVRVRTIASQLAGVPEELSFSGLTGLCGVGWVILGYALWFGRDALVQLARPVR